MKRLLFLSLLFCSMMANAQSNDSIRIPDTDAFLKEQMRKLDSANTANSIRSMNNNMTSFMHEMSERNRKEKQRMWMRFAFAGAFIIIAIIGFARRRKQKAKQ